MTNTLHRFGDAHSFRDDYVVFAIASRGKNDENSVPKLKKFLEIALQFKPVNLGDARHGGALRPSRSMKPLSHWNRDNTPDFQTVIDGFDTTDHGRRRVRQPRSRRGFRQGGARGRSRPEHQHLDVHRRRRACCDAAGIPATASATRSGFEGKTEHLPNSDVLTLSTMCGHGMVSMSLAKKMIDWVKEGRRTPEQASVVLTRFCSCGVFNPVARAPAAGRSAGTNEVMRAARTLVIALAIGAAACGGTTRRARGGARVHARRRTFSS